MPSTRASADTAPAGAPAVLTLTGLGVTFDTPTGTLTAAENVTLSVAPGECLAVVGESGAGKSQVFLAVMGLLAANGRAHGSARFGGAELLALAPAALDRLRGAGIAMVFQDPMSSLTPHLRIGEQLVEVVRRHTHLGRAAAGERALALLERVRLGDARQRLRQYPHQLSGGLRQRVMIALALAGGPQLLIADEPTTALDVTVQAQILALLAELRRECAMAMVLISHDLGAVAGVADRVVVMQRGRVIESGTSAQVLKSPREPYTRTLVGQAAGLLGGAAAAAGARSQVVLTLADLSVDYPVASGAWRRRRRLTALRAVSFELHAGESLGIVGESGCGKSTLARAALELLRPAAGSVVWMGEALAALPPRALRARRRELQIVFQDPPASLDPRMSVGELVAEPLYVHEPALTPGARAAAVQAALAQVALAPELMRRYPHELSGGQCQRVAIARAMILTPKLLVCDEPLSALDVPTQLQIVTLLAQLQRASGMALLFISHNLALVRRLCERVLVLYLGRMMELAPTATLYHAARHPYSRELLSAIPSIDPDIQPARLAQFTRGGEPPSPLTPPSGCVYRTRCPHAAAVCAQRIPAWEPAAPAQHLACLRWREIS
jgi:peptide/nickel transport system ATP-binding protein